MSIWKRSLDAMELPFRENMVSHVGIKITGQGDDFLKGTMPVDHRTIQPMGILHGGAFGCSGRNTGQCSR